MTGKAANSFATCFAAIGFSAVPAAILEGAVGMEWKRRLAWRLGDSQY